MKKNLSKFILFIFFTLIIVFSVSPAIVSAQGVGCENIPPGEAGCPPSTSQSPSSSCALGNNPKFQNLLGYVTCIISRSVIPLIFALALVSFIWGVVQFVINSSEEAKKEKGRQFMVWGIIALAVMVSVWGLVAVLTNTFNINTTFIPQVRP